MKDLIKKLLQTFFQTLGEIVENNAPFSPLTICRLTINLVFKKHFKEIFNDINARIFNEDHVDLNHIYIDGSKFEADANKYSWVFHESSA